MKFQIKTTGFLIIYLGLFFIMSCYVPPNAVNPGQTPISGQTQTLPSQAGNTAIAGQVPVQTPVLTPTREPSRASDDRDRARTRDRRRDESCESERESHECYDLCKEIYTKDRDECLEEDPDIIEKIYDVYKDIEKSNDFNKIDLNDFKQYIDVSTSSLLSIIRDYSRGEAEDMLVWIAENNKVAEILSGEDEDFRILDDLLSTITSFDSREVQEPFIRDIDRDTLMDYALQAGNDEALDYFLEYVFRTSRSCDKKLSTGCLEVICLIGRGSVDRDRDYYLDSPVFEDFMSDIIKEKINSTTRTVINTPENADGWDYGTGAIDSVSDLGDSWANKDENNGLSVCLTLG